MLDIHEELNKRESKCIHVYLPNARHCKLNELCIITDYLFKTKLVIFRWSKSILEIEAEDVNLWLNCQIGATELVKRGRHYYNHKLIAPEEVQDFLKPVP